MRFVLLTPLAVALALCGPATASAYCRTTTIKLTRQDVLDKRCPGGLPVYWDDLTIHYGFDPTRASRDLSEADVREVFAQAFARWEAVTCEDGAPGFELIQDAEPYAEPDPHHVLHQKNVNVMLFRPAAEWEPALLYPPEAFALTTAWYDVNTGQMLGADMELNEGIGPWVRCPDAGCTSRLVTDLANVVTHEAGHVLGLGESYVEGATMLWKGSQGDTDKRDLAADDIAGLCEAYAPAAQLEREPASKPKGHCALSPSGGGEPVLALLGLVLGALRLRRRER